MAFLQVFAHHGAVPPAFGTLPPASTTALPAPVATYWCELTDQVTVDSAGFGPPIISGNIVGANGLVARRGELKPADDGYTPTAVNFKVSDVCVRLVVGGGNDYNFVVIPPTGAPILLPTAPSGAMPLQYCAGAGGLLGKGVWKVEVRQKPGITKVPEACTWDFGSQTIPLFAPDGAANLGFLAMTFEGVEVFPTPPTCHTLTGAYTLPPCWAGGNSQVQVAFTLTISPAAPAYTGSVDWEATDANGTQIFSSSAPAPGGATQTINFPGAGDYDVSATVTRPGCTPATDTWSAHVIVPSCDCPTFTGSIIAYASPANSCEWNFSVGVNNPQNAQITYDWDFDVGSSPPQTSTTATPGTTNVYTTSGSKTVEVTLRAGNCKDVRTTQITVVDCAPTSPGPGVPGTGIPQRPPGTRPPQGPPVISIPSIPGFMGLPCTLLLVTALVALAGSALTFLAWGCTGFVSAALLAVAVGLGVAALLLLGLWVALCRACPQIRLLANFLIVIAVVLVVVAGIVALFGQVGCALGAVIAGGLFAVAWVLLRLGAQAIGCPP